MKLMIASFVFLYGLIGCGPPSGNVLHSIDVSSDESGNVDFTHVDDTSAHEPFEPGVAAGFWQQRLQYDIGNQEMMRVQKAADVTLRFLGKGRLHVSPTVDVSVTGGFTGSANFTALVRTKVTARYSVSNTDPSEKIEEYLFQDKVGIFTDSNKVSGHFRQECRTLCREGRYEISGTVNLLARPMSSKRRDICQMVGDLKHTSDNQREQYCFVWQKNPDLCMKATHDHHPIAGCDYDPAILIGRVTTEIDCHFDSGWTCAVKNQQAAECSEAKAEPGASNFCHLILDILTPREPQDCWAQSIRGDQYLEEQCLSFYNNENFRINNSVHWSAAWFFDQERKFMTQALLEQHCVW